MSSVVLNICFLKKAIDVAILDQIPENGLVKEKKSTSYNEKNQYLDCLRVSRRKETVIKI